MSSVPRQGVTRLVLSRFRSYETLTFTSSTLPVVLTGSNGAGKTNLLEALSFLSPGRGLRQVKLGDVQKIDTRGQGPWAIAANLDNNHTQYQVGTAGTLTATGKDSRQVFLNETQGLPQARLTEIINVLWLTPAMDRLFLEGASSRRKFLDRLVYSFDTQHASRINRFELKMRERNRLLEDNSPHHPWLSALEKQMTDDAFDILSSRFLVVERLRTAFKEGLGPFPIPTLDLTGILESDGPLDRTKFIDLYGKLLESGRLKDMAAGRTLVGPHTSDFVVTYEEKQRPAHQCSTGEQKALLVAIILGAARLKARCQESITLILLDEIVAHLDEDRRQALLNEILALPIQAWMTGTDDSFFRDIRQQVQHFQVENSMLKRV